MYIITQIISDHLEALDIRLKTFVVNKIIISELVLSFSQQTPASHMIFETITFAK